MRNTLTAQVFVQVGTSRTSRPACTHGIIQETSTCQSVQKSIHPTTTRNHGTGHACVCVAVWLATMSHGPHPAGREWQSEQNIYARVERHEHRNAIDGSHGSHVRDVPTLLRVLEYLSRLLA